MSVLVLRIRNTAHTILVVLTALQAARIRDDDLAVVVLALSAIQLWSLIEIISKRRAYHRNIKEAHCIAARANVDVAVPPIEYIERMHRRTRHGISRTNDLLQRAGATYRVKTVRVVKKKEKPK